VRHIALGVLAASTIGLGPALPAQETRPMLRDQVPASTSQALQGFVRW
jgi:hypothetical protein